MSVDYAGLAYGAWSSALQGDAATPWDMVDERESSIWVAVEHAYLEAVAETPQEGDASVVYDLQRPREVALAPGVKSLPPSMLPAKSLKIRRPLAGDMIDVERYESAERQYRVVNACLSPVTGRFLWRHFENLDVDDMQEIRRIVDCHWPSLLAKLYSAWRTAVLEVEAVEFVDELHPDDAPAFIELERDRDVPRGSVLRALESLQTSGRPDGETPPERWEGPADWAEHEVPEWEDVSAAGGTDKFVWTAVGLHLATEGGEESLALFSPGVPRKLVPRERLTAKDMMAMQRGETWEARLVNLAGSLCGVDPDVLRRMTLDDYERVIMATGAWLGKRQRELTSTTGSRRSRRRSRSSAPSGGSSSPSP